MKFRKKRVRTPKKNVGAKVYFNESEKNLLYNQKMFFPWHAECLIKIMKANSQAMGKQPTETLSREDEE